MSAGRNLNPFLMAIAPLIAFSIAVGFPYPHRLATPPPWAVKLERRVRAIDASTHGELGVYVKKLGRDEEMNYHTDRDWYFASTVKVPVAIAVLQSVEEGKIRLDQRLILKRSDPVDGSGEVQFKKPGSHLSVAYLLEKMLTQSDSTATDLLIHLIGEDNLNQRIRTRMGIEGFKRFTTILQVRKDAYRYLHPNARYLTNLDFIALKRHHSQKSRYRAVAKRMQVPISALQEKSIGDAFEKYYRTGLNSGSLRSYGLLLEKLVSGKLLSRPHTQLILKHMLAMRTGEHRIKAGLPRGTRFAQKTGTQVARVCNMGIVFARRRRADDLIVTACMEKFHSFREAERTLQQVGRALTPLLR